MINQLENRLLVGNRTIAAPNTEQRPLWWEHQQVQKIGRYILPCQSTEKARIAGDEESVENTCY